MTVTPVGNLPSAALKKVESKEGEVVFMSGCNTSNRPLSRTVRLIDQAVVQTRRTSLPELKVLGLESIAPPVRRAGWLVIAVFFFQGFFSRRKLLKRDGAALWGGPSTNLRAYGTRLKVFVGLGRSHFFDNPFDANFALERLPEKQSAGPGLDCKFDSFTRLIIGEK